MVTSALDVVYSAVLIGVGGLVGGGSTVLIECLRRRADKRQRAEELRRIRFVDPIVAFVDDLLAAIDEAYWAHLDARLPLLGEKIALFQARGGAIEARVLALADDELYKLWQPFSRKLAELRVRVGGSQLGDVYATKEEAVDLGSRILRRLFPPAAV